MLFWLTVAVMITWHFVIFEPPQPVMSRAGVMTHPACAKFSSEIAVATCEQAHPTLVIPPISSDNYSHDKYIDEGS